MMRTRSKFVCKNHFNLSSKQIRSYRKFIRKITNKRWISKDTKTVLPKIQFVENRIHTFSPDKMDDFHQVQLDRQPQKGILKGNLEN